jgi:hypothetical protein
MKKIGGGMERVSGGMERYFPMSDYKKCGSAMIGDGKAVKKS